MRLAAAIRSRARQSDDPWRLRWLEGFAADGRRNADRGV